MNCELVKRHLDDYVDGELSSVREQQVAEHLQACADCRDEAAFLRRLVEEARLLPRELAPARDLWPEIEQGIRARPIRWTAWVMRAAALAAVLAVALALPYLNRPQLTPSASPPVAGNPENQRRDALDAEYSAARQELLAALDETEGALAPEVRDAIVDNLRLIEQAVTDIRLALDEHPNNPQLERLLLATYRTEMAVLQEAVRVARSS